MLVHRLVCAAFHGPQPPGHQVRHLNGIRDDNRAANLRWGTIAENMRDKLAHGTAQRGERNGQATITADLAARVVEMYKAAAKSRSGRRLRRGEVKRIAETLGVSRAVIGGIIYFGAWSHVAHP